MFDILLETVGAVPGARRRWALPLAAGVHAAALGGLIATSLMCAVTVVDPDLPFLRQLTLVVTTPIEIEARLGDGGAPLKRTAVPRHADVAPEAVQPRAIPPPAAPAKSIEESPVESSPPTGLQGLGDGIGSTLGVPWGVPDGSGDGPPGGAPPGAGAPAVAAVNEPVPVSPDMVQPVLVTRVQPDYPVVALRAHLPGTVVLQAVIGEDGSVQDVSVLRASSPLFVQSAIDAVHRWRYTAALQSGRPVRVYFTVRVEFRIE